MPLFDELHRHRNEILQLASECGLKDVRVFGSVARGEERPDSDIDILVNRIPGKRMGLKTYGFPAAIEAMFGRKVDFVIEPTLHWAIRDDVLREAKRI